MTRAHGLRFIGACLAALFVMSASAMTAGGTKEWRFGVLLDGKPIGYHRFELSDSGAQRTLRSEARFNVKVLFINVYRYEHDSVELWQGDCLSRIDARTDDNGSRLEVRGAMTAALFVISSPRRDTIPASCVQTFAYWNPQILTAGCLLNPQTGEYLPVRVEHLGPETLAVRGVPRAAQHYRLSGDAGSGGKLLIDLWYSPEREWLALESTTANGRRLRYQLQ